MNIRIIGELELGSLLINSPIVAVTGTNGKTTTVSMLDKVLSLAKIDRELVGNIGVPITSKIDKLNDYKTIAITEVSSFQLETTKNFTPHVACILNITPDHLERHFTMENYIYLKSKIFQNQRESEYAVINIDDKIVRSLGENLKAKVYTFSLKDKTANAYLDDGALFFNSEKIIDIKDIFLQGEHNYYNALATIVISKILGVSSEFIRQGLIEFKGARHRIEFVKKINEKSFFNDSKGTNTASTITAIKMMKNPTVLILGGKEKGENYDELFEFVKKGAISYVVLTGESSKNMLNSAIKCGLEKICVEPNFEKAIYLAEFLCDKNGCVLFSPACASFDKFSSYAERGEAFIKAVDSIEKYHSSK
jgi:UDP-N-acetylmuramoylalanine--D-glutamate ligase